MKYFVPALISLLHVHMIEEPSIGGMSNCSVMKWGRGQTSLGISGLTNMG
jgi:hypothetical protein